MKKQTLDKVLKDYKWKLLNDFYNSLLITCQNIKKIKKDAKKELIKAMATLKIEDNKSKHALEIYESTNFKLLVECYIQFWIEVYKELNNKDKNDKTDI